MHVFDRWHMFTTVKETNFTIIHMIFIKAVLLNLLSGKLGIIIYFILKSYVI